MQSVLTILNAIERGEATPRETVARSLDAIAARDAAIGAFVALPDSQATLGAAERAKGPLAGIAVGVKDIIDTHDLPTAMGSPVYAGNRPAADAALVAMLRDRGASLAGKTVATEFAFLQPAATVNPHDPAHTPGGSSSGSAAAVAAGMVPVAIGTQTGGSVIRPAAYCGVAGYKPSFRLVPMVGVKTFSWSLDTAGFFAAGAADVAAFVARLTGRPLEAEPVDPSTLRIGLYRTSVWDQADADSRAALSLAAECASAAGAGIVDIDEPEILAAAREAHSTIQNFEAGIALGDEYARHRDRMSDILRTTLAEGRAIAPETYDAARGVARRARHETGELFRHVDLILTPSVTGAAPRGLGSTGSPVFNKLWSLTGNPCVNVPGISNAAGMPVGVQLVARFGRDRHALSAAAWLESLLAGAVLSGPAD